MQMNLSLPASDIDRPDECIDQSIETISSRFNRKLQLEECDADDHEQHEEQNENEDDNDDDDDEFTFMLIGDDEPLTGVDKVFENDQIRPVFPLFDQKLLLEGEINVEEIDRLQIHPPVDRIFIQSEHEEKHGPYCDWSKQYSATATAELSKKSNSTGFSKLWRLKEKVGRSNSDGRDAFVFLKHSDRTMPKKTETTTSSSSSTGDGKFVKVNVGGVVKQKTKVKKATVSAHEVYMKSRGGHTEEERRRSYLPYRPELMGFFTNVHGGLAKNVHPY